MSAILRTSGRRAAVMATVLLVGIAVGVAVLAMAPDVTRLPAGGRAVPVLAIAIGWSFLAVGCYAQIRRPDNLCGPLLAAFGLAVVLSALSIATAPLPFLVASIADPLVVAVFVHLLLAFPSGRIADRSSRRVVACAYAVALVPELFIVLFDTDLGDSGCADCPDNPLLLAHDETVAGIAGAVQQLGGLVLIVLAIGLAIRGMRAAGGASRRSFGPLLAAGAAVLALGAASAVTQAAGLDADVQQVAQLAFIAAFATLPAAFLVGLLRSGAFRTATVGALLERLTAGAGGGGVGGALSAALGDPSLTVGYWLPERDAYVDRDGRPFAPPPEGDGSVTTELVHQGRRVGVLVCDASLAEDASLMTAAAGAAALALENDRLEVALRARIQALRESRARIVEVADGERRRLGRDLHDGAQQRLVSLLIELQLAEASLDADPVQARENVGRALTDARAAVGELRELAAGIHPAVLSQRGLDAAVESLAARCPVPVELDVSVGDRLPAAVESAAYFVVSEALANVSKYAGASYARVVLGRAPDDLVVTIADDGVGGADASRGSGLRGLADRVGALDGTLDVSSPEGEGTIVRARLPLGIGARNGGGAS
jgi:signal transduction histidine kinase